MKEKLLEVTLDELQSQIDSLKYENEELKDRLDKVIEKVSEFMDIDEDEFYEDDDQSDDYDDDDYDNWDVEDDEDEDEDPDDSDLYIDDDDTEDDE